MKRHSVWSDSSLIKAEQFLNERIEFFFRNIIAEAIKKDNLMPC
jgi:hypothetical protein